jgi:CubicO group peptidase (beta-lactamase class C family)
MTRSAFILVLLLATMSVAQQTTQPQPLRDERRAFQSMELTTGRSMGWIFNVGDPPRIVWRDAMRVKELGGSPKLHVRWFDADDREFATPNRPGRWTAYVEGKAPNGTPVRRSLTLYARPPGFLVYFPTTITADVAPQPGPINENVWREHADEINRASTDAVFRNLNDSEIGATLIAGLSESKPLGRRATLLESAQVLNDEHHLRVKLKAQGLEAKVHPPAPPRKRAAPATVLHDGSPADAGVKPDAKQKIDAVLRAWAVDSGEPFVTLVARRGVIVTHVATGIDGKTKQPIDVAYRSNVASITKTLTAVLFSQFYDQRLIDLDAKVSSVFPDWPTDDPHVPTFRQCFTHTSGFSGHGEFGGSRNPQLENVLLNGIDANEPGTRYEYTGTGFDLAGKAMEIVAGQSITKLFDRHLFQPLGISGFPVSEFSYGAELTAHDLGVIAQWFVNRGSYGDREFCSPQTFQKLLPEPLDKRFPGIRDVEGIGNHWMQVLRPAAGSTQPTQPILGPHVLGHGALSGCMLMADLDRELVIVQSRRQLGPRHAEWQPKFLQAVMDNLSDEPHASRR